MGSRTGGQLARQVRSGRTRDDVAGTTAKRAPTSDVARLEALVVGVGPVAAAIAAAWDGPVRRADEVPLLEPGAVVEGADVVVLVTYPGDLTASARGSDHADVVAHTQRVLAAARATGVRHVVAVTSAVVHGAWAGRPTIHDDEPVLSGAAAPRDGIVGHLLAAEAVLARGVGRRGPLLTVLRPAAVVGGGADTFVTRHFEAPRLLTVRGAVREWQFVHVDDVASAALFVVQHGLTGTLTVGAPDLLSPEEVERAAGMRHVELAAATAFGTAERLHRVGVLPAPASELAYVVYPWTVAADALTAAGWTPRWSSADCLRVLLEGVQGRLAVAGRRLGSRDAAAIGAAGAAVAVIGTAAVWRQARGRRRP